MRVKYGDENINNSPLMLNVAEVRSPLSPMEKVSAWLENVPAETLC